MSDNEIKHKIISIKRQPTTFGFAIKSNCLVQIFVQVNCASKILHSPIMHTDLAKVREIADKCRIRVPNNSPKYNKESYSSMKQSMTIQKMMKNILELTVDTTIIFLR